MAGLAASFAPRGATRGTGQRRGIRGRRLGGIARGLIDSFFQPRQPLLYHTRPRADGGRRVRPVLNDNACRGHFFGPHPHSSRPCSLSPNATFANFTKHHLCGYVFAVFTAIVAALTCPCWWAASRCCSFAQESVFCW